VCGAAAAGLPLLRAVVSALAERLPVRVEGMGLSLWIGRGGAGGLSVACRESVAREGGLLLKPLSLAI